MNYIYVLFTSIVFAAGLSIGSIINNKNNIIIKQESEWMTGKCLQNGGIKHARISYAAICNDGAYYSDDYDAKVTE